MAHETPIGPKIAKTWGLNYEPVWKQAVKFSDGLFPVQRLKVIDSYLSGINTSLVEALRPWAEQTNVFAQLDVPPWGGTAKILADTLKPAVKFPTKSNYWQAATASINTFANTFDFLKSSSVVLPANANFTSPFSILPSKVGTQLGWSVSLGIRDALAQYRPSLVDTSALEEALKQARAFYQDIVDQDFEDAAEELLDANPGIRVQVDNNAYLVSLSLRDRRVLSSVLGIVIYFTVVYVTVYGTQVHPQVMHFLELFGINPGPIVGGVATYKGVMNVSKKYLAGRSGEGEQ